MNRIGPARLTFRGLRLVPGVSALVALLVLVGAFLAVGAPRQTAEALTSALHQDLGNSGGALALTTDVTASAVPFSTDITGGSLYDPTSRGAIAASLWPKLASQLADVHKKLGALGPVIEPGEFAGSAGSFAGSGTPTEPRTILGPNFTLEATPSLQHEARLATGRWPRPVVAGKPLEVVISAKTAAAIHWELGQTQSLAGTDGRSAVLVGTVAPRNPKSAFWQLDFDRSQLRTVYSPSGTVFYYATVWVNSSSWPKLAPTLSGVDVSAWLGVDLASVSADQAPAIAAQVRRFMSSPSLAGKLGQGLTFTSDLPQDLLEFTARSGPSTALIALFELGPAGALAAVLLLGLRLLQARRSTVEGLIRARGGSGWQLRLLAAGEVAIWTVPAAILGTIAAVLLTPGQGSLVAVIVTAVLCGLVAPIAAAVPAEQGTSSDRRSILASAARPVAEATIVLVALLVLATLVARGPVTATSGVDPLVELAPLLLAIAVTVVLVRVTPFGVRWVSSGLRRGRSAVSLVASSGTALNRRGGAAALFALVVGVGMSVFSLTMVATQQQGVQLAALNQTGADVAVSATDLTSRSIRALEAIPGVAASATVQTIGEVSLPQSNVFIFSVDPAKLASVQRDIPNSPLLAVHGADVVVADVNNPPKTVQTSATGDTTLRLHRVNPQTVSFVLSDPGWMLVDRADLPKTGVYPQTVGMLIRVRAGVDPATVAAAAQRAAGSDAVVRTAARAEATIIGSPIDRLVQGTIVVATTLAGLLCLAVFVMTLAAGAAQRLRRGAILRALGFDRRQGATLVLADIVPTAIVGIVAGTLTGVGLAAVVLHTIDPTAFIGAAIPIGLVVNIPTTALVLAGFLVAAVLAGVVAVFLDLNRPATAGLQTLGEER